MPLGKKTLLMGILNVAPDSFSDGGRWNTPRKAVAHAIQMQEEGADLIDVGAESTRPGARPVSPREELKRVLPVIEYLSGRLHIPISIDTSKALVAKTAVEAGAGLINDVTALSDPEMPSVVAQTKVPVILMHMRGTPQTMHLYARYKNVIQEVLAELQVFIKKACAAGVSEGKILIDPGLGFAKRPNDNLVIMRNLSAFKRLGCPIVIGPSRKSFIGKVIGEEDPGKRLFGTAAAVACGIVGGADIVRIHDVNAMRHVAVMTDALVRG